MRVIVLMLLVLVSGGTAAEWVAFGGSDSGSFAIYVDPTIRRSGNMVKMWVMFDFKTTQEQAGRRYLSQKEESEYDCKDARYRTIYFSWHSGNMGSGNTVYSDNRIPENWRPVAPVSVVEDNWKAACGKQ